MRMHEHACRSAHELALQAGCRAATALGRTAAAAKAASIVPCRRAWLAGGRHVRGTDAAAAAGRGTHIGGGSGSGAGAAAAAAPAAGRGERESLRHACAGKRGAVLTPAARTPAASHRATCMPACGREGRGCQRKEWGSGGVLLLYILESSAIIISSNQHHQQQQAIDGQWRMLAHRSTRAC